MSYDQHNLQRDYLINRNIKTVTSRVLSALFTLFVTSGITGQCYAEQASAEMVRVPILSAPYDLSRVIKDEIVSAVGLTAGVSADAALFTIGGLSLDAYVLSLPLQADVKRRVIKRISTPVYAIRLGYFLAMFKERYSTTEEVTPFREYVKSQYQENELPGMEHSLFTWNETATEDNTQKSGAEPLVDRELIATFVTIFDALHSEDPILLSDEIPDHYEYLTRSAEDMALVRKIQPLIIDILTRLEKSTKSGDIKDAISTIIKDDLTYREGDVNNKAEAVTISLIDFVRMNTLKNYRQYRLEAARVEAFKGWMLQKFSDDPQELIRFLEAQNDRRHAVQITVDGLQGEYLKSLTQAVPGPFLTEVYKNHQNKESFRPATANVSSPEVTPKMEFLDALMTRDNQYQLLQDSRYLPFFKQIYQNYALALSAGGISSTPTISVRNLPLIWTGAGVAGKKGTGVPNFHFVDRQQDRAYYFFGNDALQLDLLLATNNVQTMFDRLNHLKTLNCNAQYDWNAHVSFDALINLALGESARDFGELLCIKELRYRAMTEQSLREDRIALIDELKQYQALRFWRPFALVSKHLLIKNRIEQLAIKGEKGMPDYLLAYFPWPDHFAHFVGPFSDELMSPTGELNRLDYWLGEITKAYQQAGSYDRTLWGMAGDHGLATIFYYLNPETEALADISREIEAVTGKPLIVEKISSDEGEGPKITNALNYPSNKGVDVVVASTAGGNFMMDFFVDQGANWSQQPLYTDMIQWRPISYQAPQAGIDMIVEISERLKESLDYLVVRESLCNVEQCSIRLVAHRGGVRHDEIISRIGDKIHYGATKGKPVLLDLDKPNPYRNMPTTEAQRTQKGLMQRCVVEAESRDLKTWCTEKEWRMLAFFSPRPDSVNQLAHLYDEDRAGTINLFPKEGIGYNTKVPGRHAGEHFHEKDAYIGFWGVPVTTTQQLPAIDNGSLAPTMYDYLIGEQAASAKVGVTNTDAGWGFPSVLNQLVQ